MKVAVCIASRGRQELLTSTLVTLIGGMTLPDTEISIALDDDDPRSRTIIPSAEFVQRTVWSSAPREDSLGAKYNRAQQMQAADLYVLWPDDAVMPDKGWDAKLAEAAAKLLDQCGVVLFGHIPGILQPGIAMTQKFIDAQGFFNAPYFPFWFGGDTWPLEVATMSGRYVHADVHVELIGEVKGKSRGVREITFWAELFDRLRPSRIEVAKNIINSGPEPLLRKRELLSALLTVANSWLHSNSILRNPVRATELEKFYAFDNELDARYLRLKAKAEKMMEELNG